MTKSQLASVIAGAAGITKKQAAAAIDAFAQSIGTALASGDRVSLGGFGSFSVREKPATKARTMPKPGDPSVSIKVAAKPATRVAKWRPAKELRERVAKKGRR